MQIKTKLTLLFLTIVALTVLISSIFIYLSSAEYRETEFYERLAKKSKTFAHVLLDEEEINIKLLKLLERTDPATLPEEQVQIFDVEGQLVYSSENSKFEIPISNNLKRELNEEVELKFNYNLFEVYGVKYKSGASEYLIFAGAIDKFGLSKLKNLRNILIINFIAIVLIIAIVAWFFSAKALSPISKIIGQVENISENNLNQRLDEGNKTDEIAKLALTFNKMLERLELAFILQKNFVANASHELRTPLTAMTGQLEVLLMNERSIEDYKVTINSVLDDIRNLSIICNRLLHLAQTNADRKDLNFQNVRVDDLLWQIQNEIVKLHPQYNVNVQFVKIPESEDDLTIVGNAHLLKTAFNNFIENGCKFSNNNTVNVEFDFDERDIFISFKDKGIGINKADLELIFQPFYRTKNALSFPGHGLGLSLTEKIINIHQGKIEVISEPKKFTTFIVALPKKRFTTFD